MTESELLTTIGAFAPTIGVVATGLFGYMAARSNNLSKSQFSELKGNLDTITTNVDNLQATAEQSNVALQEVQDKLSLHDESHLAQMRRHLDRDINQALVLGWTNSKEFELISRMYQNYKKLGGNGYIDRLIEDYQDLPIKEG